MLLMDAILTASHGNGKMTWLDAYNQTTYRHVRKDLTRTAIYAATPEQLQRWAGTHSQLLEEEEVVVICQPSLLGRRKYIKAETLSAWRYSSKAPVQTPGASGLPRLVCRPRGRCPVRVTSSFP